MAKPRLNLKDRAVSLDAIGDHEDARLAEALGMLTRRRFFVATSVLNGAMEFCPLALSPYTFTQERAEAYRRALYPVYGDMFIASIVTRLDPRTATEEQLEQWQRFEREAEAEERQWLQ